MINVGLIGYGYWGRNLLRNLLASKRFKVSAVAEQRADRLEQARIMAPGIRCCESAEELVDLTDLAAVLIATPVATHFPLARRAIIRGRHVLVEKPMCATVAEGEELVALAAQRGTRLMVDHTFLFTAAVQKLRQLNQSGALGKVSYYDSLRVNLGLFQPDVNVLWDLAPHDFSILDYVIGAEPVLVEATGYCHVNPHLPDIAYVTIHCTNGLIAHFNLSWMSPVKVRRIAIGGDRQMVVWNDLDREEKVKIYDSGIQFRSETERLTIIPEYRIGDVYSPRISNREALIGMIEHFADVIEGREQSIMSGEQGLRIVRMLEAAQASLDASLARVAAAGAGRA
jgi:predicted dehydrogenase